MRLSGQVDNILKCAVIIICFGGVLLECATILGYVPDNPEKTKSTVLSFLSLIALGLLYDRTDFFLKPLIRIKTSFSGP
jgi:hypothetical protein